MLLARRARHRLFTRGNRVRSRSYSNDRERGVLRNVSHEGVRGLKIHLRAWRHDAAARGVVVIVPGFNSHSGYYTWVAEQLLRGGLSVYAVDLRGRGESDGERFYVDKFAEYVS